MNRKIKIGVIGCGVISEIYMKNIQEKFDNMELICCADINREKARARAEQFRIMNCTVEELLKNSDVDIVLNLTIPEQHAIIGKQALMAGKCVYSEKPLATTLEDARELIKLAKEKNLLVGSAPDTFLGEAHQKALNLLKSGEIGAPFAAHAFLLSRGPEHFHPNPEFLYKKGAGPLLDWGPYYISWLVELFGPVRRIVGLGKTVFPKRKVLNENSEKYGQQFNSEVYDYVTALLEFESGNIVTFTVSFDNVYAYWESDLPFIEVYGTSGTMDVPDVNKYGGNIRIRLNGGIDKEISVDKENIDNRRGIGLAEMARCLQDGSPYHTNAEFAMHVTEVILGIQESVMTEKPYIIEREMN